MTKIKLASISPDAPADADKVETKKKTLEILENLNDLQNLLYAENKHSILIVVQGMDAAGKDGLTRDVFTSMNPQGVDVISFKEPTQEELSHDFLWRVHRHAPAKGMITIFNRSHYEDVLITRVHGTIDDKTAAQRMEDINAFEKMLHRQNNTHILKFYLHVSHKEQLSRLEERIKDPKKMWKYNEADFKESKSWDEYMEYYEAVFENCNDIPWQIIPSDQNWYKSFLVAKALEDLLMGLKMKYPGMKGAKHDGHPA